MSDGYGFEVDAQKPGKIMMRYEYFKAPAPGNSVDPVTFKLRCPPKHYAVAGGCQTNDNKEILYGSYAETNGRDPSGWVCVFSGFGQDTVATVQAYCQ